MHRAWVSAGIYDWRMCPVKLAGIRPVSRLLFFFQQDTMGRLTTHALDTANGLPGRHIEVRLFRKTAESRLALKSVTTNQDGRCDQPLLEGEAFTPGIYELDFSIGAYFSQLGASLQAPAFLDVVTLRFGVADASQHFHVPIVFTPWSYSTYRGS
jgi:5-hydroxyisourate hydrolase